MSGSDLIAAERHRQVAEEGWTPDHDDDWHGSGQLARAAAVYASPPEDRVTGSDGIPRLWPWVDYYKPTPDDRVRELVKAGALIAAEIDRLLRGAQPQPSTASGGSDV